MSLKRRYRGGSSFTLLVEAGERRFTLDFSEHYLKVEERAAERVDLCLRGDEATILALFFRGAPWAKLLESGKLWSSGPKSLERALERAFEPPQPPNAGGARAAQPPATTRRKLLSKNSSVASKSAV